MFWHSSQTNRAAVLQSATRRRATRKGNIRQLALRCLRAGVGRWTFLNLVLNFSPQRRPQYINPIDRLISLGRLVYQGRPLLQALTGARIGAERNCLCWRDFSPTTHMAAPQPRLTLLCFLSRSATRPRSPVLCPQVCSGPCEDYQSSLVRQTCDKPTSSVGIHICSNWFKSWVICN